MTSDGQEEPSSVLPGELLDLVGDAVVLCDEGGAVEGFNRAAGRIFPRLRVGDVLSTPTAGPLAQAVARGADRFAAAFEDRSLDGRRKPWQGRSAWLVRDTSAARDCEEALLTERDSSAFLEAAAQRLGSSLHHASTVRALARAAVPVLADVAVVVLPPAGKRTDWHRAGPAEVRDSGYVAAGVLAGVPRVADALYGRQPRPAPVHPHELDGLGDALPWETSGGGSALVLQLSGGGVPAGALILLRGPERAGFGATDSELAHRFAARAGLALATAALYSQQAHTVAVLQESLRPEPLPVADGLRLGAAYRPAAEALRLSGDFYHVARHPEEGVTFFFGDVCGKGAEAAVSAGRVRQSLRMLELTALDPLRELEVLNEAMLDDEYRFTTLLTGSARPLPGGGAIVETAGGGHLPPLVLRGDGRVEEVTFGGTVVGAVPDPSFGRAEFRLEPGEAVVLHSDGVTEARGGPTGDEMYGEERLAGALASCLGMPAGSVAERLELLTTQWLAGRTHDDIAVLVLQAPPLQGGARHGRSVSR